MRTFFLIVFVSLCLASCKSKTQEPVSTTTVATNEKENKADSLPSDLPYASVDISPMDMTYFPVDYPKLKMAKTTTELPLARVIYSRPHLQGRRLFPNILKYGEPWRLGANEATELQLFKPVSVMGKKINPGRYVLYCIPTPEKWTIIFNSNIDSWGLQPDSTKDIARFDIPVIQSDRRLEYFSMAFTPAPTGATLMMAWDDVEASLPFEFESGKK